MLWLAKMKKDTNLLKLKCDSKEFLNKVISLQVDTGKREQWELPIVKKICHLLLKE